MAITAIRLFTGMKMPVTGFGIWLARSVQLHPPPNISLQASPGNPKSYKSKFQSEPGEAVNSVRYALNHGFRLIDAAACYFSKQELGKVLNEEYIKRDKLKREDILIDIKLSLKNKCIISAFCHFFFWSGQGGYDYF
uniref:NADP-dependent oxidoreductase domain-containing protein n=1 Tax=Setaria digitata TaxID=48799 RepID=A0A915PHA7_9BILA